ncbi:MAG: hypothetical protein EOO60_08205 [Hymenobacter sp.]|nr:MAG: hypothetical protein EOO60_08205 [Hymenobacter sp.]
MFFFILYHCPFMKHFATYLLVTAVGLASLASCKKDAETTPALSKTDLLTAKSWKVTDIKVSGQSIYATPLFAACDKDDLVKFNASKSATFDEGTLKCDPTTPQSRTGSWDFTSSETKLKVTDPDGTVAEGTIGTLTSTTLIVTDPNGFGTGVAAEVTYTAQ